MKILVSLMLASLFLAPAAARAAAETSLELTSGDFPPGGTLPARFTCDGSNDSPGLRIRNVPERAKSLVLIMEDSDNLRGPVTHWLVWNITPDTASFTTDTVPNGVVQGTNENGKSGYIGPCPRSGQHRYYFRLYAIDYVLTLPPTARRKQLEDALKGHVLAETFLLGRYGKAVAAPGS